MISVIVPVYNSEKYIKDCVDSVTAQSFTDWELLLVDDGSTDNCGKICDEYAQKFEKVKVLHQVNGGQIAARKAGALLAKGEYITFLDSDDWVNGDYLEKLFSEISNSDSQMVTTDLIYNSPYGEKSYDGELDEKIYDESEIKSEILPKFIYDLEKGSIFMRHTMPGMIYESKLLKHAIEKVNEDIRFDEDGICILNMLLDCKKLKVSRYKGYHYRENEQSVNHSSGVEKVESLKLLKEVYHSLLKDILDIRTIDAQLGRYIRFFSIRCMAHELGYKYKNEFIVPNFITKNDRIYLYGAGQRGLAFLKDMKNSKRLNVVGCVDKNFNSFDVNLGIESPERLIEKDFDYVLIAIEDRRVQRQVEKYLLSLGISYEKIWPMESDFLFNPL